MAQRDALVALANRWLQPQLFKDYCPNGLQVEGRTDVNLIVSGVTASQALLDAALAAGADLVLVHHGYFWKGEPPTITGMRKRRLQRLLAEDVNLLAYHLPLDAHPELGNNAQLARVLEWERVGPVQPDDATSLLWQGMLRRPMSARELAADLEKRLGQAPVTVAGGPDRIKRVAWCTGAAQGFIAEAASAGVDAFISGEISEPTVHVARECGIHYFAAGHHATERYGVQALGERLGEELGIRHRFIDIPSPA